MPVFPGHFQRRGKQFNGCLHKFKYVTQLEMVGNCKNQEGKEWRRRWEQGGTPGVQAGVLTPAGPGSTCLPQQGFLQHGFIILGLNTV